MIKLSHGLALMALVASLAGCGTTPAPIAAGSAPAGAIAAQGLDVESLIDNALADAEDGEFQKAASQLSSLRRKYRIQKPSEFEEYLLFARAHRRMAHIAAEKQEAWVAPALTQTYEARDVYNKLEKELVMWTRSSLEPARRATFTDVMVVATEAADAMLDRFPTLPADQEPKVIRRPSDYYPYVGACLVVFGRLSELTRTDADVAQLKAAVHKLNERIAAAADMPAEVKDQLTKWAASYERSLKPRPARTKK